MKYRQWKKNYKKKHGVNPPLWLDRKKRRRYIRKRVRRIAASLEVNVEIITKGLEASVMAIKKRLIELQERIVISEQEQARTMQRREKPQEREYLPLWK